MATPQILRPRARILRALAGIAALCLAFAIQAQDQNRRLRTYSMQRALPEQVLPALEPLLSNGSSVQAYQNQLILNVTDGEYREALDLLKQLDVASRSLLISVRKATDTQGSESQYGVDGRIGSGNVQVRSGDGYSRRTEVRAIDSNHSARRDGSQQVRAVEGMPAFISAGTARMVTTQQTPYGSTREVIPAESGFYATARVIGNEVVIDIDQRDDRMEGRSPHSQRIATQGIQTQVRGRVGEWIPIGALGDDRSGENRGLLSGGNYSSSSRGDIALKVDVAPQ